MPILLFSQTKDEPKKGNPQGQKIEHYYDLGRDALKDQDWDRAIDAFNHALELQPNNPDARVGLANAIMKKHTSQEDLMESEKLSSRCLEKFPE